VGHAAPASPFPSRVVVFVHALRMSHGRFSLWVVFVLAVGVVGVRAQFTGSITKKGDSPTGSVYEYVYTYNPAYYLPGGGGYGTAALSGLAAAPKHDGVFQPNVFSSVSGDVDTPLPSGSWSGTFTVPTGKVGTWVLAVRPTGGSYSTTELDLGLSASGTYSADVKKAAQLNFNNPSSVEMTYEVYNGATLLGTIVVPAGGTATQRFEVGTEENLSVVNKLSGYEFSDGVWIASVGHTVEYTSIPGEGPGSLTAATVATAAGTGSPSMPGYATVAAGAGTPAPVNTVPVMPNYPSGTIPTAPGGGATVWTPTTGTDVVTNPVFRQGVDKLVAEQKAVAKAVVDQLKANDANAKTRDDAAKVVRDKVGARIDAENTAKAASDVAGASMSGQGAAAKAEAEALFGSTPTSKGWALTPGGAPDLSVTMPSSFGGGTFQFNPFTPERLGAVASWFRAAVEWLTIATLGVWVWSQLGQWVRGVASVQQAKGNPVVGGTGAQATALAAAGLMTVALVAALTALLSWSFESLNLAAFVASVTANPLATVPTGALWMLDQILPVATMVTALVARLTFNLYASTVYAGCAAVVRFIVP